MEMLDTTPTENLMRESLSQMIWEGLSGLVSEYERWRASDPEEPDPEELDASWFDAELLKYIKAIENLEHSLKLVSASSKRYRFWQVGAELDRRESAKEGNDK